jgi:hypothetical protein
MMNVDAQIAKWGGESRVGIDEATPDNLFWRRVSWYLDQIQRFVTRAANGGKRRPLRIALINDERFNARATICVDGNGLLIDLIGINLGMLHSMADTFFRLFGHPSVMPALPGADKETAERVKIERFGEIAFADRVPVLPLSGARFSVAVSLVGVGLDFIVHHELAHLLNGHVDYLSPSAGMQIIDESDQLVPAKVNITRYALEFDADASAVSLSLQRGLDLVNRISAAIDSDRRILKDVGLKTIYANAETYVYHFSFVVYVFFRLFYRGSGSIFSSDFHPAPQVRLWWTLCTVSTAQLLQKFDLPELTSAVAAHGALDAEKAIAIIIGRTPDLEMIQSGMRQGSPHTDLASRIREEWARIRPLLEPFSRGGKLAPADPNESFGQGGSMFREI